MSLVPGMKIILVFRLVALLGKYALENEMRIYVFLRKRSGGCILEKWKIVTSAFVNHRIRVNRLASYLH